MWNKLTKQIKNIKLSKKNKDRNSQYLLQKFDISKSFPSLILEGKNKFRKF